MPSTKAKYISTSEFFMKFVHVQSLIYGLVHVQSLIYGLVTGNKGFLLFPVVFSLSFLTDFYFDERHEGNHVYKSYFTAKVGSFECR